MAPVFFISDGPPKWAVIAAVLDGRDHLFTFTLKLENTKRSKSFKQDVSIRMAGVDPNNSSGELLNIEVCTAKRGMLADTCVLRGRYRTDTRTGHLEQIEPTHATVKIVVGIPFVWVPCYEGRTLREHWLSTSGHRVRVYEPSRPDSNWLVEIYGQDNHDPYSDKSLDHAFANDELLAFTYAIRWVKYGLS